MMMVAKMNVINGFILWWMVDLIYCDYKLMVNVQAYWFF
jgi:hypothetical protein